MGYKKSRLPAEYQEVEYIESHGAQYIATDFIPTIVTKTDAYFMIFNSPIYATLFGTYKGEYIVLNYDNSQNIMIYCNVGSSGATQPVNYILNQKQLFRLDPKNRTLSAGNNKREDIIVGNIQPTHPLYIFRRIDEAIYLKARLYSLVSSDDEGIKMNSIPCRRKSDSKPGVYDIVNNVFYTNRGSGEFTVGADVNE